MVDVNPHVTAVQTLLAGTGKTVYTARAPSGAALPYIVFEPGRGLAESTSFGGDDAERRVRFVTRYFGTGWEQVDALASHVFTVLSMQRPSVTGRKSERIRHETEFPTGRDEDLPTTVIFAGDSWTFCTWPS